MPLLGRAAALEPGRGQLSWHRGARVARGRRARSPVCGSLRSACSGQYFEKRTLWGLRGWPWAWHCKALAPLHGTHACALRRRPTAPRLHVQHAPAATSSHNTSARLSGVGRAGDSAPSQPAALPPAPSALPSSGAAAWPPAGLAAPVWPRVRVSRVAASPGGGRRTAALALTARRVSCAHRTARLARCRGALGSTDTGAPRKRPRHGGACWPAGAQPGGARACCRLSTSSRALGERPGLAARPPASAAGPPASPAAAGSAAAPTARRPAAG